MARVLSVCRVNYYYAKYTQTGSTVGNFLRVQMIGPELGFNFSI